MTTLTALTIDAGDVILRKAREDDRRSIIEHVIDPDVQGLPRRTPTPRRRRQRSRRGGCHRRHGLGGLIRDRRRETDAFIGTVSLTRRGVHHPGHLGPSGEELELAYTLNRPFWGRGLAYQAALALLRAASVELPDEPVIVVTQSANTRSLNLARRLGFVPAMTFEEFGERADARRRQPPRFPPADGDLIAPGRFAPARRT